MVCRVDYINEEDEKKYSEYCPKTVWFSPQELFHDPVKADEFSFWHVVPIFQEVMNLTARWEGMTISLWSCRVNFE